MRAQAENFGDKRKEKKKLKMFATAWQQTSNIYLMVLTFVSFIRFWLLIFVLFTL